MSNELDFKKKIENLEEEVRSLTRELNEAREWNVKHKIRIQSLEQLNQRRQMKIDSLRAGRSANAPR